MRRDHLASLLVSMLLFGASSARAIGFGQVDHDTSLGQPLDLSTALSLGPDEALTPDCISADVLAGDTPIPARQVRVRLAQGADPSKPAIRVQTLVRIDEPVVTVRITAGCSAPITQRFVVFVDPPAMPQLASNAPSLAAPATASAGEPPTRSSPATASRPARSATASSTTASTTPSARRTPPPTAQAAKPSPPALRTPRAAAARNPVAAASSTAQTRPRIATAAPVPASAADGGPRLVLDAAAPTGAATAAPAASGAASATALGTSATAAAALTAAAASSADVARELERVRALNDDIDRLRREQQATQQALATVSARLRDSGAATRISPLLYVLLGLVVCLLLACAWLLGQRARLRKQVKWWSASRAASRFGPGVSQQRPPPADEPVPMRAMPVPVGGRPQLAHLADDVAGSQPGSAMHIDLPSQPGVASIAPLQMRPPLVAPAPMPMPVDANIHDSSWPQRELSVEELQDLEQQADFFIVLGQDDAAIDLLMGMVRSSGGAVPMPYLKLMDIFRHRLDHTAYDRIRERFNQRFNGTAPAWETDPTTRLTLEGYPAVLLELQGLWATPLQAVAALEAKLFRRDGREPPFELPAFTELLFLHRLARDLSEQDGANQGVDLLLPFDDSAVSPDTVTIDRRDVQAKPMPPVGEEPTIVITPKPNRRG